jgi:hypothetical protein
VPIKHARKDGDFTMTDPPAGSPAKISGGSSHISQRIPPSAPLIPPDGAVPATGNYRTPPPEEPPELRYARQTRNSAVFIAVLAGIAAVVILIGVIIVGVQLRSLSNIVNGTSTSGSNCLSQGGTNPYC